MRRIGAGSGGVVYEVEDRQTRQRVALKTLRYGDVDRLYRLKREFRALAEVSHRNVVALHELVVEGTNCFVTMELVGGIDFISYIRGAAADEGEVCTRLRETLPQLAQGLQAIHDAGVVHRDIKPSNVIVTSEGRVVILDFGLASIAATESTDSLADHIVGTPKYLAPEQAGTGAAPTPAADWYSVGALMFEALVGQPPFAGSVMEILLQKQTGPIPDPTDVADDIPTDLAEICVGLLARDPAKRIDGRALVECTSVSCPAPTAASTSRGSAPDVKFSGRRSELALLRRALRRVEMGTPAVALIEGTSGIGKTTLARHFIDTMRSDDPLLTALEGRCYERESVPYKAMDSLVDGLSHLWRQLPSEVGAQLIPPDASLLPTLFPVLKRVRVVLEAPTSTVPAGRQELRARAVGALRDVLHRLADRRTLVLFLDDFQWVDEATASLLTQLLRPPDAPRVCLILGTRDGPANPALDSLLAGIGCPIEHIRLGGLSEAEAVELARHMLPDSEELAALVARQSAGSPFLVTEVAGHLRTQDPDDAVPFHIGDVLRDRIGRLSTDSRRLMEVLAMAGTPISRRVLAAATEVDRSTFDTELRSLCAARLVRVAGARYDDAVETYHNRLRTATLDSIDGPRRTEIHRDLALALEECDEGAADILARHWLGAGRLEVAAKFAEQAGHEATERLDFDRGAQLFQMALSVGKHGAEAECSLRTELAEALAAAGRPAEAAEQFRIAALDPGPSDAWELRRRSAEELLRGGYVHEGLEEIRAVLGHVGLGLPSSPRRALFSMLSKAAWIRLRGVRWSQRSPHDIARRDLVKTDVCRSVALGLAVVDPILGADYQARHLLAALRLGEPQRVARALAMEAGYLAALGRMRRARFIVDRAKAAALQSGNRYAHLFATSAEGILALFGDNAWRRSLEHLTEAAAGFSSEIQAAGWELDTVQFYECLALLYLGDMRQLSRRVSEYLQWAKDRGDRYAIVNLRTRMSMVALANDDPRRAAYEIERGVAAWDSDSDAFQVQHFFAMHARIELALYRDDVDGAEEIVREAQPAMRRSLLVRIPMVHLEAEHLFGRVLLARAARDGTLKPGAARTIRRCARRLGKLRAPVAAPMSLLLLAGAAHLRGETDREIAFLRDAIERFEALETGLYAGAARLRLAAALGGSGGKNLAAETATSLRERGVRNPDRIAATLAPGW